MKKLSLLSLIFTFLYGMMYGQHLIRVNNNPAADADYLTLQAANDNASDGDTIYIEGSTTNYEGADLSRKLTIIGPGYWLSENDSTQANGLEAIIYGNINFNDGSAGSSFSGLTVHYFDISVDNITISRCKILNIYISSISDVENILISQNYLDYISSYGKISNSIISNNIVNYQISTGVTSGALQITNNIITAFGSYPDPINVYSSTITNNIICYSNAQISVNTGNTITNNILAVPGTDVNGNKYNIVMADVFVDYSGSLDYSDDAKWKLKTGSPAIAAGVSGVDCGVFGGVAPYVLSGMPALPHIYEATIPATAISDEGLSCTLKVKSGK